MTEYYSPMSKEFQDECKRLGLTGRQLTAKYKKEGKSVEKGKYVEYKIPKICCNCKSRNTFIDLIGQKYWHKHECQKVVCTGYLCNSCYRKYDSDSIDNIRKSVCSSRTRNQDPNDKYTKADRSQELACKLYGWIDLNKENDNYEVPIDCYDPKTGLYHQIQVRYYNCIYKRWPFGSFEKDWGKIFEDMICFCISKDGKTVERIYKFPLIKIVRVKTIVIYRDNSIGWYEDPKYRVINEEEVKTANDIWRKIVGI